MKDERGVVALEFAIVGPLVILMICMFMEVSLTLFSQVLIDYGVDYAARQVQIGRFDQAEFKQNVCTYLKIFESSCARRIMGYAAVGLDPSQLADAPVYSDNTISTHWQTAKAGDFVLLEAGYDISLLFPLLRPFFPANTLLVSTVVTQTEP